MQFLKPTKVSELVDFCGPLISSSMGDTGAILNQFSSLDQAEANSFAFLNSEKLLPKALESSALCLLAPLKIKDKIKETKNCVWLFSPNVDRAAQLIKKEFVFPTPYKAPFQGIHKSAVLHESCQIGELTVVSPFAVIGKNVSIGKNCFIGSHTVIEENCTIGDGVTLHPHVYIGHSCDIGNECEIMPQAIIGSEGFGYAHDEKGQHYRIPHTGRVIIEDDVHIGGGTAIDRGTLGDSFIGRGTKIDNQVHLAHNTIVGKNGLITAQVVTAGSSQIGDNFICGGKTAIAGHIKVTDNVNVAAFSAISNNVKESGQYGGYPLQPLKHALKVKASSVHLPELRKQMNRVLRKLFPEDYK